MFTHLVHDLCFGASVTLNCILIALILTRTPTYLRSYSIVLLYLSIVELTTAIASLLVFKKVMSTSTYSISAVGGVCRHWGSPTICYYLNTIQLAGMSHYAVMIAFCACYRYYVIRDLSRREPRGSCVLLAIFCIHLPTIVIYANCARIPLLEGEDLERAMNESYPDYDIEKQREKEMIVVTRLDWLSSNWIQFIIVPVCIIIFTASVKINAVLRSVDHMSLKSRQRHAHILKGLLCQATLPALYVVSIGVYRAGKRIGVSEDLGHLIPTLASLLIVLSPLLTIIFTIPYKEAVDNVITTGRRASNTSINSQNQVILSSRLMASRIDPIESL